MEITKRDLEASAWSALDVSHSRATPRRANFGVTDRGGIFAMHAGGKGAFLRRMGAVQAPQPIESAERFLAPRLFESSATHLLSSGFIVSG